MANFKTNVQLLMIIGILLWILSIKFFKNHNHIFKFKSKKERKILKINVSLIRKIFRQRMIKLYVFIHNILA